MKTMIKRKRKSLAQVEGFHFDEVAHAYTLDGKPLHGVTSVLRVIAKPALIQWSADMAVSFISDAIEKLKGTSPNEIDWGTLFKEARIAHRKKKEAAGEAGTGVHEQIEAMVKDAIENGGGLISCPEPTQPQVFKFYKWGIENNVHFLESEKRVLSKENWYAGTLDLVLEMDGKKYIADVKTSSAIYPEFYLQMAAYQLALEEMEEHTDIKGAMVINLDKKGGFEIGYNYDYDGNRMAFLAALVLYKQLNALK